jgi:uncharacterized protein YbaA (DUF1428 family)
MYVDGFVLAVPRKNIEAYKKMSRAAGRIWREYGAVEYVEAVGNDLKIKKGLGVAFPRLARARTGETVLFSWILYKSRAQRDRVNKKIMKDPRIAAMMNGKKMPFDVKRMAYGGFKTIVNF